MALTADEISQLFAYHMAIAKESTGAEFDAHYARAQEFSRCLPDTPLETQVQLYERAQ